MTDAAIPLIDVAPLVAGDPPGECEVARRIGTASRDIRFFYITGHGIAPATRTRLFTNAAAFFGAPAQVKEAAAFTGTGGNRGYIRLGAERLNPDKPPDVKEAFNIGLELAPDDPDLIAAKPFRAPNVWPEMAESAP